MVGFLVTLACSPLPKGDASRPDIILVSIDSLRRDHLPSYGYERNTAPFLKELGEEGTLFENARSASPWTLPAHTTMLTGLWPTQHTVVEDDRRLSRKVPMIQEFLSGEGWVTGGFTSTFYVSRHYGFDRGFKFFQDYHITEAMNLGHPASAEKIVHDAMEWAKKQPDGKPIFLFLHFYDVHYPYVPTEKHRAAFNPPHVLQDVVYRTYEYYRKNPPSAEQLELVKGEYDECILGVDEQLEWLHQQWRRSGRKVDWVVTSDHGEEFGERGSWGHAHTLYPEVLDVPLIAAGPDFPVGRRTEEVGHIDLAPTFAGIAGKGWEGPGVDLRAAVPERTFLAETSRFKSARISVEKGGERLDVDRVEGREERYDRRSDPAEKHPLDVDNDTLRGALFQELGEPCQLLAGSLQSGGSLWEGGQWVGTVDATLGVARFGIFPTDASFTVNGAPESNKDPRVQCRWSSTEQRLDPKTKEQLEQLGYIQNENPP